ncbi:hypothetical protein WICMUC_001284 [Wickerhamomyces mucosus]|uniref:Phosducin domain-containing protein n=1 Tax=Wickerhamomyces mucosus TaxID=1378264 RepID=A0A9P8PVH4_9ASCO|nr:hypothetical protein WICMUC_001284 [Wickerhamomyces mucosus]
MDKIIDDYSSKIVAKNQGYEVSSDEDEDGILELLENDEEFTSKYRESRIEQFNQQLKNIKKNVEEKSFGNVETLLSEDQVIKSTTNNRHVVLHFYHENFPKCLQMDSKLQTLSQKHLQTKFIRIKAEDAPFLVTRLKIKILPCVILYINGIESNRIVGFDKLNYNPENDQFKIESLENFLLINGVIPKRASNYQRIYKKNDQNGDNENDEESDLDL